jgi:microcystin degradation protein MlrC
MARIAIGGFMHETNCFVPERTGFDDFAHPADRPGILRGDEIVETLAGSGAATAGFLEGIGGNHEMRPLLWTGATAGGTVTADAYERIAAELLARLSDEVPVDGVYLDLHGAMVAENHEDGEGELLSRLRAIVGDAVPVVISLDYHANVTARMVAMTDAILPYWTYPHVDQPATGGRAAAALSRLVLEGRAQGRALRKLPFLLPLNFQCTLIEPSKGIVEAAAAGCTGDVVSLAYLAGFPPSDLSECGPAVIAHAHGQAAADQAADDLAQLVALKEAEFAELMLSPDEAVAQAMRLAAGATRPVIIADTQDNPGCGGSGDTVEMLAALLRNEVGDAVFGLVADAEAARAAHEAGPGAELDLALGGRTELDGVRPFVGRFRVEGLADGRFTAPGPVAQGRQFDVGPSALLSIEGVKVAVSSRRAQVHDRAMFRYLGVEPESQKIIVLKSTCHFRADYEAIAEAVLVAIAPGGYVANPAAHPYRNLRPGVRLTPLGRTHGG